MQASDYASDANPHKAAARTMLAMTRHINADWKSHVGDRRRHLLQLPSGPARPGAEIWFQSAASGEVPDG